MNVRRVLIFVLIVAAVCLVSAGVGAAEEVNIIFKGSYVAVGEKQ